MIRGLAGDPERWQLISDDAVWMFPYQVRVSTVSLSHIPIPAWLGDNFESCVFWANGEFEIAGRYESREQAYQGHRALEDQYGLTRRVNPWNHYLWD